MIAVLLDTHAWVWSLTRDIRLSRTALAVIEDTEKILVSPISFFEISQKVRLGKWPEMEPYVDHLAEILVQQGGVSAGLEPATCVVAGQMEWAHRDPFDRLIAATALHLGVPLISADPVFDGVVMRVW